MTSVVVKKLWVMSKMDYYLLRCTTVILHGKVTYKSRNGKIILKKTIRLYLFNYIADRQGDIMINARNGIRIGSR